jgi:hypothetical protein
VVGIDARGDGGAIGEKNWRERSSGGELLVELWRCSDEPRKKKKDEATGSA